MINHSWLIIVSAGFFVIVLIFLAAIGFLIYAIIELKKIGANLKEFIKITEDRMAPVLTETEQTLKSIKKVSNDLGTVSENAKNIAEAAGDIAVNLRAMSLLVRDLREGVIIRTSGVMAGVREAYYTLIKQLRERR